MLFDVAVPQYKGYFARSANLVLSAQATALWLQAQREPAAARATWLRTQINNTALAERLVIHSDGQWQLRALADGATARPSPTRWPAWPA